MDNWVIVLTDMSSFVSSSLCLQARHIVFRYGRYTSRNRIRVSYYCQRILPANPGWEGYPMFTHFPTVSLVRFIASCLPMTPGFGSPDSGTFTPYLFACVRIDYRLSVNTKPILNLFFALVNT